ncbi:hypothetical protein F4680DRAFT_226496 [Xylaria scruposa]|nr:hypothetical protein F4680DRAFT_226496 [Xylaria scruposa]
MTVMVPDCVIVLSLHVDSQMKMVLSASEVALIEVMLLVLGTDEGCVTVKDPDVPADTEGNCDELGALGVELVGPADPEELDGGNNPDVDRAESGMLVLGRPVDGVTAEPVKEISGAPELGLGLLIELVPTPADEVPSWLLTVTVPVFIDVSIGPEDGPSPVVRVSITLEIGLVTPADDMLPEMPDDSGIGLVSEPVTGNENVGCGMVRLPLKVVMISEAEVLFDRPDDGEPTLIVDMDCETVFGLVIVSPLVILTDGKEVALVRFVIGCGPEVKVWLGTAEVPVPNPELISKVDPLKVASKLVFADTRTDESEGALPDAGIEPCEVRGEPVIETLSEVSSVVRDETASEVIVELEIVKELNPVSDTDTVPLGPGGAVELARVKGGMTEG